MHGMASFAVQLLGAPCWHRTSPGTCASAQDIRSLRLPHSPRGCSPAPPCACVPAGGPNPPNHTLHPPFLFSEFVPLLCVSQASSWLPLC